MRQGALGRQCGRFPRGACARNLTGAGPERNCGRVKGRLRDRNPCPSDRGDRAGPAPGWADRGFDRFGPLPPCWFGQPDPRDGRRSEHRSSSDNRIDSLPRSPPGSTQRRQSSTTRPMASRSRSADHYRPASAKGTTEHHAFAITPDHHRRTRRVHAPSSPPPGDHQPPLLLHQWLRQLPRARPRRPASHLSGLRVPPPPELI